MISNLLKAEFSASITFDPLAKIKVKKQEKLPVDYFSFYQAVSCVYSSKIEGENIDFDSFFKYKFLNVAYKPNYTKKSEDLFKAYQFIQENSISEKNILQAHKILSHHLLPQNQRGKIRNNPMFVLNADDRIEYVACPPNRVKEELQLFFNQLEKLLLQKMTPIETFFYAAQIHLAFVKIHPMQDGNGRTARLLEKWFLLQKLGNDANYIELEKNYFTQRKNYYQYIKNIGLEYENLDWSKALSFLQMTIFSLS